MNRFVLALLMALFYAGPATGQEMEQSSLRPVELRRVDPAHNILHQIPVTFVVMEQREEKRTVTVGTQKRTISVIVCTPRQERRWVKWTLQDYQVLDAKGSSLAPAQIWERFRDGMDVYRAPSPLVGPEMLRRLPKDAMIIVPRSKAESRQHDAHGRDLAWNKMGRSGS